MVNATPNGFGVTTQLVGNHCEATFDVSDPKLNDSQHPETNLLAGDKMTFVYLKDSKHNLTYDIGPPDNGQCAQSPVPDDPEKHTPKPKHTPGAVLRKVDGPKECRYHINFHLFGEEAAIDPHIKIGGF